MVDPQVDGSALPVFLGTLDDMLESSGFMSGGTQGLAIRLAQAAVSGGPVLIVEGFLLNSPAGRAVLCDTADRLSPFHALARHGFLTVLRRGPSLAEVPERVAPQVPKFARLVASADWPDAKRRIANAERILDAVKAVAPWPKRDVGDAFRALLADLASRPGSHAALLRALFPSQLARLLDVFADMPADLAARSAFQAAAERVIARFHGEQPQAELHEAMRLAAETYHVAFAACLACEGRGLSVETRFSPAYSALLAPPVQVAGSGRWRVPILRLPEERFLGGSGRWWARLDEVVATDGALAPAKRDYLKARDRFLRAPSAEAAALLSGATQSYADGLARLFRADRRDFTETLLYETGSEVTLDAAMNAAGQAAMALGLVGGGLLSLGAAPLIAAGGGIAGVLLSRALRGVVRQRFVLRSSDYMTSEALDGEVFRRLGGDAFACLPLAGEAARRLVGPLPETYC